MTDCSVAKGQIAQGPGERNAIAKSAGTLAVSPERRMLPLRVATQLLPTMRICRLRPRL